ncbi:BTB/POZ domain-containing protein KCTD8-like [Diadema setosum]|uniref:BTB/POZ domain-containing protein KCTD8-like n=1 Tax=Diadema setosum TaxID=31175 RepID=UPI003B3A8794
MASYIGLNVGGKIYETSEMTLTSQPGSFFTSLLSGSIPSAKDDRGNYRIDRDGKIFRYVLNYLRDNELILPEGFNELTLLEREADFYQLESLKADIQALLRVAMPGETISLDVGGTIYTTTREVLSHEPDSVFQQILKDQATPDPNGRYLIAGDGKLFRYILKYLRFGFLALPHDFDVTSLKDEARFLKLEVFLAHIMICRLMFPVGNTSDTAESGLAMFARRNDFVLYSQNELILKTLSAVLLTKSSYQDSCSEIQFTSRETVIKVLVLPIALNRSRAGEPIRVTSINHFDRLFSIGRIPYHSCVYPANRDELVALLSKVVGMETNRKVFTSSYLGVFGLRSDSFLSSAIGKCLAEIF